jgi:hypothetical protein
VFTQRLDFAADDGSADEEDDSTMAPSADDISTLQHQLEYFRTMRQRAEAVVQQLQPPARHSPAAAAGGDDADAPRRGPRGTSSNPDDLAQQIAILQQKKRQLDALGGQVMTLRAAQENSPRANPAPLARASPAVRAPPASSAPDPKAQAVTSSAPDPRVQAELSELQRKREMLEKMRAQLSALRDAQAVAERERIELESRGERDDASNDEDEDEDEDDTANVSAPANGANSDYEEFDEAHSNVGEDDNDDNGGDDNDSEGNDGGSNYDNEEYDAGIPAFEGPVGAELLEKFKLLQEMQDKLARLKAHQQELQAQADAAKALGDAVCSVRCARCFAETRARLLYRGAGPT